MAVERGHVQCRVVQPTGVAPVERRAFCDGTEQALLVADLGALQQPRGRAIDRARTQLGNLLRDLLRKQPLRLRH